MEENKTTYIINIGDFTADDTTYPDRCLSASFGGEGVAVEAIPWEDTEHNPWDYKALYEEVEKEVEVYAENNTEAEPTTTIITEKHYTGEFELDAIPITQKPEEPTQLDRVEAQTMWTALMTDTLLEESEE